VFWATAIRVAGLGRPRRSRVHVRADGHAPAHTLKIEMRRLDADTPGAIPADDYAQTIAEDRQGVGPRCRVMPGREQGGRARARGIAPDCWRPRSTGAADRGSARRTDEALDERMSRSRT
jgi:hypothetical protein